MIVEVSRRRAPLLTIIENLECLITISANRRRIVAKFDSHKIKFVIYGQQKITRWPSQDSVMHRS